MSTRTKLGFDIGILRDLRPPSSPSSSLAPNPAAGPAALAVATALLRALKERGLLSTGELDDLLADALGHLGDRNARRLLEDVRANLERDEAEETA